VDRRRRNTATSRRNAPSDLDPDGRALFGACQDKLRALNLWDDVVADQVARMVRLLQTARKLRAQASAPDVLDATVADGTVSPALVHALDVEREARMLAEQLLLTPAARRRVARTPAATPRSVGV
jgi:phage terminase small subunit